MCLQSIIRNHQRNFLADRPSVRAEERHPKRIKEIIGVTENLKALRSWMIAGPERPRCLMNFEDDICSVIHYRKEQRKHHNQD